jgi:diadenosine tetraphosphatase ApaH/serine/threonine PP2A family protein phosphatase
MRYGILADVHGNLFALRAAVQRLRREGLDEWLCAGDLIGYGPHPNECVEVIAELGGLCVAGNHELLVLGELPVRRCGRLARETIDWTGGVLREDCRSFLAGLPRVVTAPDLVMTHGSLDSPEEYVTRDIQAAEQLRRLRVEHPHASLLIVGHTHRPWLYSQARGSTPPAASREMPLPAPDRFLLNPGSVGQSRQRERQPRARFMLVDLERRWVRFYEAAYDVEACREALRGHRLPRDCIHVRPGLLATVERRSRNLLRRSGAAAGLSRRRRSFRRGRAPRHR